MDLKTSTRDHGSHTIVAVAGDIDVYTAPPLRETLVNQLGRERYHLIVDMTKVSFLDSTGLGVLVGCLKRVRAHEGSLLLVCSEERILKVFKITGLTHVFPIFDTLDAALESVSQP